MSVYEENSSRAPYHCERCGEDLNNETVEWLELNFKTNRYVKDGSVPKAESQGGFPFGKACAAIGGMGE